MTSVEDWEEMVEDALASVKHDPRLELADLYKTEAEVFDYPTMKSVSELIGDGHLESLDFCISTGKEANVFHGTDPNGDSVAVKIYRVNTSTFRSHLEYLWGDRRFDPGGRSKREVIALWASKEIRNLYRMRDAGLFVPEPIAAENHVVVMDFIGEDRQVAPKLNEVDLEDPQQAYDILVDFVETAWNDAELVHGDLSPFNVLVHPPKLFVIDAAQAVVKDHPRAVELLERDLENLADHFNRRGVDVDAQEAIDRMIPKGDVT